jgi:hypothetical protein
MSTIGIRWNGRSQCSLTDYRIAIAHPSQATQNQGGLNDVFQEYEEGNIPVYFDLAGCKHDPAGKERDSSRCVAKQGKRVDDELRNAEAA